MTTTDLASTKPEFEVDDAIVFLLGARSKIPSLEGQIDGITRLEKLVFLMQMESEVGDLLTEDPEFHAHHFGPFSSSVYQAVETVRRQGNPDFRRPDLRETSDSSGSLLCGFLSVV
jgi:hypothetical protein